MAPVAAIVPAAGCGTRLGLKVKKPFVRLGGMPLVVHALKALERSPGIDTIAIASEPASIGRLRRLARRYRLKKVALVVPGGPTRTASVGHCLAALAPEYDIVVIHDAARPFVDEGSIAGAIALARRCGGAVVAAPMTDTVKEAAGRVVRRTLDRSRLYRAQTPQAFRRALLERAYRLAGRKARGATDDASLVEALGVKVGIWIGPDRNIKITTKTDLAIARALLDTRRGS